MDYYVAFFPDGSTETNDVEKGAKVHWYISGLFLYSTRSVAGTQWFCWEYNRWNHLSPSSVPNEIRARVLLEAYER